MLTNSEQNPLHRLIELFFTDTGVFIVFFYVAVIIGPSQADHQLLQRAPGIQAWRCLWQRRLKFEPLANNVTRETCSTMGALIENRG